MTAYETGIHTFKHYGSHNPCHDRENTMMPSQDELDKVKTSFLSSSKIGALTSGEAAAYLTMMDMATPNASSPCQKESLVVNISPTSSHRCASIITSNHHDGDSYSPSKKRKRQGDLSWESSVCSNPPLFMSRYGSQTGLGNKNTIELPTLSESEKNCPLGTNLCFVMAMFFSLNDRILEQRRKLEHPACNNIELEKKMPAALCQNHEEEEGSTTIEMPLGHPISNTSSTSTPVGANQNQTYEHFHCQEHSCQKKQEDDAYTGSGVGTPKTILNLSNNCERFPSVTQLPVLNRTTTASASAHSPPQPGLSMVLNDPSSISSSQHYSSIKKNGLTPTTERSPYDKLIPSKNNSSTAESHPHTVTDRYATWEEHMAMPSSKPEIFTSKRMCEVDDCMDDCMDQYQIHVDRPRSHSLSLSISLHSGDFLLPPDGSTSTSDSDSSDSMGSDERKAIGSSSIFLENENKIVAPRN
jgi:hypothetical protein